MELADLREPSISGAQLKSVRPNDVCTPCRNPAWRRSTRSARTPAFGATRATPSGFAVTDLREAVGTARSAHEHGPSPHVPYSAGGNHLADTAVVEPFESRSYCIARVPWPDLTDARRGPERSRRLARGSIRDSRSRHRQSRTAQLPVTLSAPQSSVQTSSPLNSTNAWSSTRDDHSRTTATRTMCPQSPPPLGRDGADAGMRPDGAGCGHRLCRRGEEAPPAWRARTSVSWLRRTSHLLWSSTASPPGGPLTR
jgi:hypothetical protein